MFILKSKHKSIVKKLNDTIRNIEDASRIKDEYIQELQQNAAYYKMRMEAAENDSSSKQV